MVVVVKDIKELQNIVSGSGRLYQIIHIRMMNEWWRSIPGAYLYINLHGREGPLRKRFAQESLELEARKSTCLSLSLAHGLGGSFLTRKTEDRN